MQVDQWLCLQSCRPVRVSGSDPLTQGGQNEQRAQRRVQEAKLCAVSTYLSIS